jgi:hypothetical protein
LCFYYLYFVCPYWLFNERLIKSHPLYYTSLYCCQNTIFLITQNCYKLLTFKDIKIKLSSLISCWTLLYYYRTVGYIGCDNYVFDTLLKLSNSIYKLIYIVPKVPIGHINLQCMINFLMQVRSPRYYSIQIHIQDIIIYYSLYEKKLFIVKVCIDITMFHKIILLMSSC